MRNRFWKFVHRNLERAWHWVYYHKIYKPEKLPVIGNYHYTYTYGSSAVFSSDDKKDSGQK